MAINYTTQPTLTQALMAQGFIASLDKYYPNITDWYLNTVIPGIYTGNDKIVMAFEANHLIGLALGKVGQETKLRCVRVHPQAQSTGVGVRLMDRLFDLLGTNTPHTSVSEELLHHYSRTLINRYGFKLNRVEKGLYRRGKLEYLFN